ncbi:class I SAM-dependent methyltransferase [Lutibacter sp. B2]|nr:class I SAM-dependent methyltransferase [Lutibacter sp. B2]
MWGDQVNAKSIVKITGLTQLIMSNVIVKGDIVIDGTMGNGNDTLFLANLVEETGKVISFDIQEKAIMNTKQLLEEHNINKQVELIHDGHENIEEYISDEISGAIFNLGYLPKGDTNLITKSKTTIKAIQSCLKLLKKNGIITIAIYYGHEGGEEEKNNVIDYASALDKKLYHVMKMDYINQKGTPPLLIVIMKK